jgi:hypothetical protein
MRKAICRSLVIGFVLVLCPLALGVHDAAAPETVQAEPDGSFRYTATLIVGPEGSALGVITKDGRDNTSFGLQVFRVPCMGDDDFDPPGGPIPGPAEVNESVRGTQRNPSRDGSVTVKWETCDGWTLEVTTTILASDPGDPGDDEDEDEDDDRPLVATR